MRKMNIAIVEDTKNWADDIKRETAKFLKEICEHIEIYDSGEQFIKDMREYSIVFMDIELQEMDGFAAARQYKLEFPESLIIIVTTHQEYYKEGYKIEAFRYLDKRNLKEELNEALEHAMIKLRKYRKIELPVINRGIVTVAYKDIIYIETDKRRVKFHTSKGEYISSEKIVNLTKTLEKEGFYRCHKSYLVNLDWVTEIINDIPSAEILKLVLKNGEKITLGIKKKKEMWLKLNEWRFQQINR